jgi:hypothetical protein
VKYVLSFAGLVAVCAAVTVFVGCETTSPVQSPAAQLPNSTQQTSPGSKSASKSATGQADEHPHIPGAHGGIIVPIGADSYHAEAVVEKSGSLRLLLLGKDESRIQEVEIQPMKAYVKATGETDATPIDLVATPQDGDAEGKTSQFVGQLPEVFMGKAIDVTIPNLRIAGERFRVGFSTAVEAGNSLHDSAMPAAISTKEESDLYLTPGGKYTAADINANGNMVASKKFKGIMSAHNMHPEKGDRICPVTSTKSNPKFTWIIDGKPYEFCCPPCVDEYVRIAKENPEQLKDPDQFIN